MSAAGKRDAEDRIAVFYPANGTARQSLPVDPAGSAPHKRQPAVQALANFLKLLTQILYQCFATGFIRGQQIGKIERQDQTVERLACARLHQPAQPVFAQAAVEQIIPSGRSVRRQHRKLPPGCPLAV